MLKRKGFTLIELLIAIVIFSMITSLVFFALTQSISLWERADKEIEKLDKIIFFNYWIKDLLHSAENLTMDYANKSTPIFFGEKEKVMFITLNPLMNKVISLAKVEIKNGSIFYSEENLFKTEFSFKSSTSFTFEDEYELLSPVEEGKFYYLKLMDEGEEWVEEFNSENFLMIPKAVKLEFLYRGKKVEIISNIMADSKAKRLFERIEF